MKEYPDKLVFHTDGKLSVRIGGKWRYAVSQLTRAEYSALPYEAKETATSRGVRKRPRAD